VTANTVTNNTFRKYFVRFAENSGLIKFLGVPLNQTLKKNCLWLRLLWHYRSYINTNMLVVASQRLLTVLRLTFDWCFRFDLLHSRKCNPLLHIYHIYVLLTVAYAEKFHRRFFIQWHEVVIFIWCALFVTSQFDVIFVAKPTFWRSFVDICIFVYTHFP